jgi:hypothetical protein
MIVIKLVVIAAFLALWIAGLVLVVATIVDSVKSFKK